jgi:hypothetical protein
MKTNELRIGNLVMHYNDLCTVIGYYENIFRAKNVNKTEFKSNVFNLQPIPLTEEWLLKFGFEKGNHNWFRLYFNSDNLDDSDCFTYNIDSKMLCLESFYDGEKKGSIQLLSLGEKHVHQLQNLYFALTNEELTISEL